MRKIRDVNGVEVFCGINIDTAIFDNCICAFEIVEINPTLDTENRMAESAFEILEASAKSIETRPVLAE